MLLKMSSCSVSRSIVENHPPVKYPAHHNAGIIKCVFLIPTSSFHACFHFSTCHLPPVHDRSSWSLPTFLIIMCKVDFCAMSCLR